MRYNLDKRETVSNDTSNLKIIKEEDRTGDNSEERKDFGRKEEQKETRKEAVPVIPEEWLERLDKAINMRENLEGMD